MTDTAQNVADQAPSEMVKRVAWALLASQPCLRVCLGPAPCLPAPQSCSCTLALHPHARAAIEAMREPTGVMINAGRIEVPEEKPWPDDGDAVQIWRAMIDAALGRKP